MNDIIRDLFCLMEDRYSGEMERPACRQMFRALNDSLDKIEEYTGKELRDGLYNTVIHCITEENYDAFRLGLRLGLQLHAV